MWKGLAVPHRIGILELPGGMLAQRMKGGRRKRLTLKPGSNYNPPSF